MTNMPTKFICVTAGGSGGHLIPALEIAQKWIKDNPGSAVMLVTTTKKIDETIIQQYPCINKIIRLSLPTISLRRFWALPDILLKTIFAFGRTLFALIKTKPVSIISTGGFISVPVCLAAKLCRIPIDLYELNAVPGKAIKFLSKLASRIIITFPVSKQFFPAERCVYEAYPVRFTQEHIIPNKLCALAAIPGFSQDRKTIFLLGGSQGSVQLNLKLKDFLLTHSFVHEQVQIIHQTGLRDRTDWTWFYANLNIPAVIFSYTHNIANYYQLADLVITRAGAGTLFELLFFGKKSLIVPLITNTTDHQKDNAQAMVDAHPEIFTMLEHKVIDNNPDVFYERIRDIIDV